MASLPVTINGVGATLIKSIDVSKLRSLQCFLEESYGAYTGLDIGDFIVPVPEFSDLGELLVEQKSEGDLDLAVLFDRDILVAWEGPHLNSAVGEHPVQRTISVPVEELSHFVYLAFNHNRGRNVTKLEMELQSEVDRIFVAFAGNLQCQEQTKDLLFGELQATNHHRNRIYEEARQIACAFIQRLSGGNPHAWTPRELAKLQKFFHSDLSEKIHMARKP